MTFGSSAAPDFGQGAFSFDPAAKADEKNDAVFGGFGGSAKFGENDNQQQLFQPSSDMNAFGSDNNGLFGMSSDGLGIGLGFNGS